MGMRFKLHDNKNEKQFEFQIENATAKIDYILTSKKIYFTHTEVSDNLEGQGIGSDLVKQSLTAIQKRELQLVPLCPFVAEYIRRHPEWKSILHHSVDLS